eukprot:6176155-Pleurochrysis_carterae.AAC.1
MHRPLYALSGAQHSTLSSCARTRTRSCRGMLRQQAHWSRAALAAKCDVNIYACGSVRAARDRRCRRPQESTKAVQPATEAASALIVPCLALPAEQVDHNVAAFNSVLDLLELSDVGPLHADVPEVPTDLTTQGAIAIEPLPTEERLRILSLAQ